VYHLHILGEFINPQILQKTHEQKFTICIKYAPLLDDQSHEKTEEGLKLG